MAVTPKPDTGHGASVTFGTTSWAGKLKRIPTNLERDRPPVDITHMATSGDREVMAGDLDTLGPITLDVLFEAGRGLPSTTSTPETVTITYPLHPSDGSATAANMAGTALIIKTVHPVMDTGAEMVGQIVIQYDGFTGPTFTAAS